MYKISRNLFADTDVSSTELESGKCHRSLPQTPAPVLNTISGPMGARFLSSIGLGFGSLIVRAQLFPAPALDKNRSPKKIRELTLFGGGGA